MSGQLYRKPIAFTLVTVVAIAVGTLITMIIPMLRPEMHPRLEALRIYTPLEMAGKDIYQREGCNNCHTQTVRPLRTEVLRYGEYSKAGEFAYDRPHLWGSKRTGPDLSRQAYKYPDMWHYMHFEDPRAIEPQSNMPSYAFLAKNPLNPSSVENHMTAQGLAYSASDISDLEGRTEMDALVAYMLSLGHAVPPVVEADEAAEEPVLEEAPDHEALEHAGEETFQHQCSACHGSSGEGVIGPSLQDKVWLGVEGDIDDKTIFSIITNGTQPGAEFAGRKAKGGMPPFGSVLGQKQVWEVIAYIRMIQK